MKKIIQLKSVLYKTKLFPTNNAFVPLPDVHICALLAYWLIYSKIFKYSYSPKCLTKILPQ